MSSDTFPKESRQTSNWQANIIGCLVMLVVPISFCILLIWLPQVYNNHQLSRFANNLFNYPLPPQTEVISQYAEVGLMGNGNHCDFKATQTMRTQLTVDQIETYYGEVLLPPVNMHNDGKSQAFQGKPLSIFVDFDNSVLIDGWQNFTIQLLDFGYSPGLDLRCH